MKYSVLGFNQEKIINKKQKIDLEDLFLLDYIWQAQAQQSMQHIIKDEVIYVWLNHSKILEDLPILNIKEDMLKRRLKKLADLELIKSTIIANDKHKGTKAYYGITKECEELRYSSEDIKCKKFTVNECSSVKNSLCYELAGVKNSTSDNKLIENDNKLKKEVSSKEDTKKNPFLNHNHSEMKKEKIDTIDTDVDTVINCYSTICTNLPKVRAITSKRKQAIQSMLKKYSIADFEEAFRIANQSSFLLGDNDRGWKADFDFILREDKFINILEGKYGGRKKKRFEHEGKCVPITEEEKVKMAKFHEELRKNGKQVVF
jgi:hypothetical protein